MPTNYTGLAATDRNYYTGLAPTATGNTSATGEQIMHANGPYGSEYDYYIDRIEGLKVLPGGKGADAHDSSYRDSLPDDGQEVYDSIYVDPATGRRTSTNPITGVVTDLGYVSGTQYSGANGNYGAAAGGAGSGSNSSGGWAGLIGSIDQPTNTARTINPLETVSGQLQKLIDQDSPYIQSARNRGVETANARGLINSSLAAGTSERAAIDAAAPIAGQDASTYAAAGLSAQNANQELGQSQYAAQLKTVADEQSLYNQSTVQSQAGTIASDLQRQQDLARSRLQAQGASETSALQAQGASETSALQAQKDQATAQLQTTLTQMGLDVDLQKLESNDRNAFVTASAPVVQQYMQQYTAIQTQPDSVMTQEAKRAALYQLEVGYKANLTSISSIMGYDIDWGEITTPPAG